MLDQTNHTRNYVFVGLRQLLSGFCVILAPLKFEFLRLFRFHGWHFNMYRACSRSSPAHSSCMPAAADGAAELAAGPGKLPVLCDGRLLQSPAASRRSRRRPASGASPR